MPIPIYPKVIFLNRPFRFPAETPRRDNGTGIPEGCLPRVFDPFFRGEQGGTGIGLAIVERIVKTYGGRIKVTNRGGARFEFTLCDLKLDGLSPT
jgi:K+-sensing histidine kinase KdpD